MEFFTSGDWLHPVAIAFYTFSVIAFIIAWRNAGDFKGQIAEQLERR